MDDTSKPCRPAVDTPMETWPRRRSFVRVDATKLPVRQDAPVSRKSPVDRVQGQQFLRARLSTLTQIGEDWLYLALLGIIMALLSFSMDTVITMFLNTRIWLSHDLSEDNALLQYLGWCITPIVLVTFSSGFVHLCSPTAIGSGIPEMKTILRGVVLNEYLTFRTLVAKIVGLTFTLGSGLPLGKEGPFVHMASIVATLLSKLVASFQGIYENESRTSEMLSAACAVGVAATFYAPIGGVLFSIEVTTVYFAVRNYWRGFFAACCGATVWRLLGFWIKNDESISALFKTNFRTDYPFDPVELIVFSFIGATCGLAGAGYIKFHRQIVQFFRRHKRISGFLQQNRFVYPIFVTLIITTVTFPPLLGKYTASTLSTHTTIEHLFSNRTWSRGNQDLVSRRILDEWTTPDTSFHLHLVLYIAMLFWTSALASTIPIPSGLFIPVLKMGAAYGRLVGELMHQAFPDGIKYGEYAHPASIVPGSYAVVGAAALSGAVTHTISTSVILFEMTGQIVHIIPVILGVLIANAVCQSLQPSIYDSIIEIKKLPYLPPIASSNSISHRILVKDFMNTNLAYIWKERCTYADLRALLSAHKKIISFPLVESPQSMKLLGSVARPDLLKLLYIHLGRERRLQEVCRRNSDTLSPALHMLSTLSGRLMDTDQPARLAEDPGHRKDLGTGSRRVSDLTDRGLEFGREGGAEATAVEMDSATLSSSASGSVHSSSEFCGTKPSTELLCAIDRLNWDSSHRLILKASMPANYGSTASKTSDSNGQASAEASSVGQEGVGSLGELDGDELRVKLPAGDQDKFIARIVNRYDRGSSMDEDHLEKSAHEVESHLERVNKAPEIVVVVPIDLDRPSDPSSLRVGGLGLVHDNNESDKNRSTGTLVAANRHPPEQSDNTDIKPALRPLSPLVEIRRSPSFNLTPKSPVLNSTSRPTKSILKPSSTTASFSSMYKRNISSQSFTNTLGANSDSKQQLLTSGSQRAANLDPGHHQTFILGEGSSSVELTPVRQRKVRLPRLRVVDMTAEEQELWEKEQLRAHIDVSKCQIDEAPFQLVEQTSLYRVHTLFSMLGLNHAYVTSFGRLVGIVALKDIRCALEKMLQDK